MAVKSLDEVFKSLDDGSWDNLRQVGQSVMSPAAVKPAAPAVDPALVFASQVGGNKMTEMVTGLAWLDAQIKGLHNPAAVTTNADGTRSINPAFTSGNTVQEDRYVQGGLLPNGRIDGHAYASSRDSMGYTYDPSHSGGDQPRRGWDETFHGAHSPQSQGGHNPNGGLDPNKPLSQIVAEGVQMPNTPSRYVDQHAQDVHKATQTLQDHINSRPASLPAQIDVSGNKGIPDFHGTGVMIKTPYNGDAFAHQVQPAGQITPPAPSTPGNLRFPTLPAQPPVGAGGNLMPPTIAH